MPKEYILKTACADLIRRFCTDLIQHDKYSVEVTQFNADIQKELSKIPGADVVEVVRCSECMYYAGTIRRCLSFSALDHPKPDDYCSFGERYRNNED